MQITLTIQAPELSLAIHALAKALEVNAAGTLSAKNALATTITVLADVIEDNGKTVSGEVPVITIAGPVTETPVTPPVEKETPVVEIPPVEVPAVEIPTVVELRAEAQKHGHSPEGKKAVKGLLNSFGSKSISDVQEADRADFLQKLSAL